jgi:hypothetical protein
MLCYKISQAKYTGLLEGDETRAKVYNVLDVNNMAEFICRIPGALQ